MSQPTRCTPSRLPAAREAEREDKALEVASMEKEIDPKAPQPAALQRMAKLFRVLVVGGALLAAIAGSAPKGDIGSSDDPGDGGVPGW
jgi:hypothetical protein